MSDASVLTIYPTALKIAEVLKARARAGDPSLGHRLTTFPELVDLLDRENSGPPVLADGLAAVLVHQALEATGGSADDEHPRLAAATLRALGELRAACVTPEMLTTIARTVSAGEARNRLTWLAQVAVAYARRLADIGRADRHDREARVLDLLERHVRQGTRPRALAGVTRMMIAEIYDYSPTQFMIASALIQLVGDAELVTLAHPENVDASRFVERTWNRFVEDPAIADKVLPDFVARGGRAGTLTRVLANVFVEPKASFPAPRSDDRVRVVAAPSRAVEVDEVTRRVQAALDAGVAAERIAILTRDVTVYQPLLDEIARRRGVPLVFQRTRRLAEHAGVHAVLRLVRAVVDGLPRDAVVASLESPYFEAAPAGARGLLTSVGYVDEATRPLAACLTHAETRYADDASDGAPARVREYRRRALARVRRDGPVIAAAVRRLATLAQRRPLTAHASTLRTVLAELGWTLPGDSTLAGEERSEGAALGVLDRLLLDLSRLGVVTARPMPLARFLTQLEVAIELTEVELPGPDAEGVRVLAIPDARGLDFDQVFLLGLDDGSFPRPLSEDGLLSDGVRREVNRQAPRLVQKVRGPLASPAVLGRLLRTSGDRAAEEPFLFYLALSTAEQRIVVTYPLRSDEGATLVRSPFVDELTSIVGEHCVETCTLADSVAPAHGCADVGELLSAGMVGAVHGRPELLAAAGLRLPAGALTGLVHRARVERRRARYFLLDRARDEAAKEALADAFVGRLPPDVARRDRLRGAEWSATRLDELGACGFRFFAHRILHLEERDALDEGLDVREEGTLVHRLLAAVLRRADPLPPTVPAATAQARALLEGERTAAAAAVRAADPRLFELVWARAVDAVAEVIASEVAIAAGEGPERRLLEWPFRITIADHRDCSTDARLELILTGTLDRADLWLEGGRVVAARVLDYKNAKRDGDYPARLDATRALGTMSFQIPLYALALTAAPDLEWAPDARVEGGYVLVRAGRKTIARPLAPAILTRDPAARIAAARGGVTPIANRIVELVAEAALGRFDVEPRECNRYCAYRHVCRYEPPPEEIE